MDNPLDISGPLDALADLLREAAATVHFVAEGGKVPTTWGDKIRDDARRIKDDLDAALIELEAS